MKHIANRTCIVCRTAADKRTLTRIVKCGEHDARVDRTGRADGRGAYICASPECRMRLQKTRALNRAFKTEISPEAYAKIAEELSGEET